jgi:mono/diheme cytochrome c family protein
VKKLTALLAVLIAVSFAVSACTKSQDNSQTSTSETAAATAAAESAMPTQMAMQGAAKLPIPLAKLPMLKVAPGNASAGSVVFSTNCASCHGEGGKNGQVGPSLAGIGIKPGQVAYMIRNPQGVDKDSSMPKLPLTDKQVADVAAYVASLK